MNIEVLNKNGRTATIAIKDIDYAIANTLRRIMLSEVPTLAIDEVNFIKNDSALYDEIVAHRLGLVPLKTDLKSYELKETCTCKGAGCAKCELNATIKVKGPCMVYSSDIKIQDPKITSVYDNIPITQLLENQELDCELKIRLGKGKEHAKFSPGFIYYRNYPNIDIKNATSKAANDKILAACPKDVFEVSNNELKVKNILNCDLCKACEDIASDFVEVKHSETDFIFFIESFGQLVTRRILREALKVIDEKLNSFDKKLKSSKKEEGKLATIKNKISRK